MSARTLSGLILAVVAAVVLAIAVGGGDDRYTLRVPLENASGLKSGSPVVVGGVTRGEVELDITEGDNVVATLRIDDEAAPVGRDARVSIAAQNFLGQKRVQLDRGDLDRAAPSGFEVPVTNVTTPTDLDQVLSVLDADTRTRAMILLGEAGEAVVGRKVDIRTLLKEFPLGLNEGTRVLRALQTDDRALGELVDRSDRFLAEATKKRSDLVAMIDVLGRATANTTARSADLRATLARAPRTLSTLQGFLGDLEATTKPLGPALRAVTASAPPLAATLDELEPFGDAAIPTLRTATSVAPSLTRLADGATPVLRRAQPTVAQFGEVAHALVGVSRTLDGSSDNILAILENWSRAIQFRDGMSHVFRGEASISADLIASALSRLAPPAKRRKKAAARKPATKPAPSTAPAPAKPSLPKPQLPRIPGLPSQVQKLLDDVTGRPVPPAVDELLDGLTGNGAEKQPGADGNEAMNQLLDFLMGT